ncbi:hypothetical protein AC578_10165 [Pseudocercospora eumusae]|uniref:Uncharacterized protein n=1 Tax=Pseudocercospora eumusae TaxID=321146 RepID=A0A139HYX8_9PEZI|nr:hypothetical protein AC578_10165 [Pseudocercospora eumusae]
MEDPGPCFFLEKIPGEMRNRIYDYALLGEDGEMTLRSSDIITPLRSREGGEQESTAMSEVRMLEEHVDATERVLRKQQFIIDAKKKRAMELDGDHQRLCQKLRAKVEKPRQLKTLRKEISNLESEAEQMLTDIQVTKRRARAIRTDNLLGSREGESPVFRDMQKLFALSRTCKQIRNECSKLVYELNKVKFIVGTQEGRTEKARQEILHKHLQYILDRQLKLGELRMGLVIDFGVIPRIRGVPFFAFRPFTRQYQDRLRKLKKASSSMEIHFQTEETSQQQQQQQQLLRKDVSWKLALDSPESVVAQLDAQLAAERQWLRQEDVDDAKELLVRVFWPLWAFRIFFKASV